MNSKFDDLEAEVNRGDPWRYREDGAPNPITIEATHWANGHTKHGDSEFLNGVDRDGRKWSIIVGPTLLRKRLIDGEISEWDEERGAYVVAGNEGRVEPGEVVSIKFLGDRETGDGATYANFLVARRKPADQPVSDDSPPAHGGDDAPADDDDGIPF